MRTERPFNPDPEIVSQLEARVHAQWPEQLRHQPDGTIIRGDMPYPDMLGDRSLPVARFAAQILDTVVEHTASITRSPTGSGKTTNMPLFWLYDDSIDHIVVTQPRIIAARETAERMATVLSASGLNGGRLVGYDTANEGNSTPHNRIIVTTHGLTWQQLAHGRYGDASRLLVMSDEFHERDAYQDPLLEKCAIGGIRTVIASATIDVHRIAAYMSRATGQQVPILDLPGSPYKTERRDVGQEFSKAIIGNARQYREYGGQNIGLGIVATRKDIYAAMSRIARFVPPGMHIIPVHGDMTPEQQALAFREYPNGKIVIGTSILQTSLTVPGVRWVVDSGYARTGHWEDGVRSIPIRIATQSEMIQRQGRGGRTCDSVYELAVPMGYPELPRNRDGTVATAEFDVPQIQRADPTSFFLRTLAQGRDLRDVNLPDPISIDSIEIAKRYLTTIGAIKVSGNRATGTEDVRLTRYGAEISKLAIDPMYAAMIIEARKISPELGLLMMAAGAACQVQTIVDNDPSRQGLWRRLIQNENHSDIVAQLQLFIHALSMTPEQRYSSGIIEGRFQKAQRMFERMAMQAGFEDIRDLHLPSDEEREQLRGCIIAAVPEIFIRNGLNRFRDRRGIPRQLSDTTVLGSEWERLVVGFPFDLNQLRRSGPSAKNIVIHGTAVTVHELIKYAQHRVTLVPDAFVLDKQGAVTQRNVVYFDGINTRQGIDVGVRRPNTETANYLAEAILGRHSAGYESTIVEHLYEALDELQDLQNRTSQQLHIRRLHDMIRDKIREHAGRLVTLEAAASVINVRAVTSYVSAELREAIYAAAPDTVSFEADGVECVGEVTYEKNVAHIKLPARATFRLPDSFPELGNRAIVVSFGNAKPQNLADAQQSQRAYYERRTRGDKETVIVTSTAPIDDSAIDPRIATQKTVDVLKQQSHSEKRPRRRRGDGLHAD